MAKKVVATLKKEEDASKALTKVVKMVKSAKTGAFVFKEAIVPQADAKEILKNMK